MEAAMSEQGQQLAADGMARAPMPARNYCFVVDDDAGICKALSFTLRRLGLDTVEIATPAALGHALQERSPSLIFLDLGLGQSGALDVLPMLASHGYRGPVQLMSGRSQSVLDEVVVAGERQGLWMLPALVKPFRMGVVKELVAGLGFPPPAGAAPA
jgi:DNA-binding NtrC family response regulator